MGPRKSVKSKKIEIRIIKIMDVLLSEAETAQKPSGYVSGKCLKWSEQMNKINADEYKKRLSQTL